MYFCRVCLLPYQGILAVFLLHPWMEQRGSVKRMNVCQLYKGKGRLLHNLPVVSCLPGSKNSLGKQMLLRWAGGCGFSLLSALWTVDVKCPPQTLKFPQLESHLSKQPHLA